MGGDAPQGYANMKEWWNEQVTRRQVHEEARERILPQYHRQHVQPLDTWLDLPFSERCWIRFKSWWGREFVWPSRTPWWWKRLVIWVSELFASDEDEAEGEAGEES